MRPSMLMPALLLPLVLTLACGDKEAGEEGAQDDTATTDDGGGEEEGGEEGSGDEEGGDEEGGDEEGGDEGGGEDGTEESLWLDVVYPLARRECLGCHSYWGNDADSLHEHFTTFSSEDGGPLVTPGEPDESYLYEKIASDDPAKGMRMPLELPWVSDPDMNTIKDWIDGGAAKDGTWNDEVIPALQKNKCTSCHQADWGFNPDEVYDTLMAETYDGLAMIEPGDASQSALYLKMTDEPPAGERMPEQLEHWDEDELAALRQWIEDGAPSE